MASSNNKQRVVAVRELLTAGLGVGGECVYACVVYGERCV